MALTWWSNRIMSELPKFSERSLENLAIAVMRLETAEGKLRQVSLEQALSSELIKQFPEFLRSYVTKVP